MQGGIFDLYSVVGMQSLLSQCVKHTPMLPFCSTPVVLCILYCVLQNNKNRLATLDYIYVCIPHSIVADKLFSTYIVYMYMQQCLNPA